MLRSTLLKLSENKKFGTWVTSNGTTRRLARRFVAGETLQEAVAAARRCNDAGMAASLDYLGENVSTTSDAQRSRDEYLEIFEIIAQEDLLATVSCKLTQLGLEINSEFCAALLLSIVDLPAGVDNFLRIDREGSAYTQRTIAIARHDPRMIAATIRFAASKGISKDDFEFQMLYGVRTDLQRRLVKDDYRVSIYIPFGSDWSPYFMRRLAERPANLGSLVRNFFRS